jgi:SAM-dependent methyltransferase
MPNVLKLRPWLRRLGVGVWSGWPEKVYQEDRYQQRLSAVRAHLAECLGMAERGPVRIVSMCAGDGRDVIDVVGAHQRQTDVNAWLVELDRSSVATGERRAAAAGLESRVRFLNADATVYCTYQGIAPADVVLVCGVWGHVPDTDRAPLVQALARLCKPGGTVIWTRGASPGLVRYHEIKSHFDSSRWQKIRFSLTPDKTWAVATHRYCGPAQRLPIGGQIFNFRRSTG